MPPAWSRGWSAPIISADGGPYSDPLPQALGLTAVVITFGVTALLLASVWTPRHQGRILLILLGDAETYHMLDAYDPADGARVLGGPARKRVAAAIAELRGRLMARRDS